MIKQDDIVMLALGKLGGAHKKVFSEPVAEEAHRLAPDVFGWELPEYRRKGWPDKEKIRVALIRLRSDEGGRLVSGQYYKDPAQDGWTLTAAGVKWLQENEERVSTALDRPATKMPKKQSQKFFQQVRKDALFKLYVEEGLSQANRYQFADMLNCSPDASREVIASKFGRLRSMAQLVGDAQIIGFMESCEEHFGEFFEGATRRSNDVGDK